MLVKSGRLQLSMKMESWIGGTEALSFVQFVPVDVNISVSSVCLPGKMHKDPADRIIIATALKLDFPLVTRDRKIHQYRHVETIW